MDLQIPPFALLVAWVILLWWRAGKGAFRRKRGLRRIWTVLWTGVAAIACTIVFELAMSAGVLELLGD